jgi:hypothetical protein
MSNSSSIKWKRAKFFIEAKHRVPVLARVVNVCVQPEDDSSDSPSPAQLRALDGFLALNADQKDDWTHQVALDCHFTCSRFTRDGEEPPVRLRKRKDVWKHVRLGQVFIPEHGTTSDRYVFVSGGCDWEEEHGLELLFKNERLFTVGPEEGLAQNERWSLYFINE